MFSPITTADKLPSFADIRTGYNQVKQVIAEIYNTKKSKWRTTSIFILFFCFFCGFRLNLSRLLA